MKIDNIPDFTAHLPRQGHNLSRTYDFTSSVGHLLPIVYQIMSPKDTISGSVSMFSRTQPFINAANVDIDQHIDYFFVPLTMLASNLGESFFQTNENYSALFANKGKDDFPVLDNTPWIQSGTYINKDTSTGPSSFVLTGDAMNDNRTFSTYRLLWHLGMNPNCLFASAVENSGVVSDRFQPSICNFVALAYQAVYQWFYRLDEREKFDASYYSIDPAIINGSTIWSNGIKPWTLRYRPYKTDYFMGAHVAPLINSLNMQSTIANLLNVNNFMSSQSVKSVGNDSASSPLSQNAATGTGLSLDDSYNFLSTSSLRSMFAVEKLLAITGRSKKTYDAQVMAHFGVKMPKDYFHELQYLGSQHGLIRIGEVIATAQTDGAALGDIAGKGYGNMQDKHIKFTAPCHGVFIGIYSAVPRPRYYAPIDKQVNITSRVDLPIAEYYKLGMQPIFAYEALPGKSGTFNANAVQGWQMRYSQFVDRPSVVSPAFINPLVGSDVERFNQWSTWVFSKRPYRLDTSTSLPLSTFLCSPFDLNNFMVQSYLPADKWDDVYGDLLDQSTDGNFLANPALMFQRDPLMHFARLNFKFVSTIPANTLPKLD